MAGLDPAIHVSLQREESKTWITGTSQVMTAESIVHASVATMPYGFKISFCTRQFRSSATYSTFSDGHAIA